MTSDRHLVVCHDPTLDRTTNVGGAIADKTLAELLELDNSYWFVPGQDAKFDGDESAYIFRGRAPADHRFGIATLAEVIDVSDGVSLNLDIKRTAPECEPYEACLADLLRERGRIDDVIVASFLDHAMASFKSYAPEIATSAGTNDVAEFFRAVRSHRQPSADISRHVAVQVPVSFNDIVIIDEEFVEAAHRAGLAVHVWTINERDEMERLCDLEVDGIISDEPSVLVSVLEERGMAWKP